MQFMNPKASLNELISLIQIGTFFSNAEILKARAKGLKHSHKVPEYRLNLLDCTEIFIVSTLVSLAVGILTGYFLW